MLVMQAKGVESIKIGWACVYKAKTMREVRTGLKSKYGGIFHIPFSEERDDELYHEVLEAKKEFENFKCHNVFEYVPDEKQYVIS